VEALSIIESGILESPTAIVWLLPPSVVIASLFRYFDVYAYIFIIVNCPSYHYTVFFFLEKVF
jgi:hypothetical protein